MLMFLWLISKWEILRCSLGLLSNKNYFIIHSFNTSDSKIKPTNIIIFQHISQGYQSDSQRKALKLNDHLNEAHIFLLFGNKKWSSSWKIHQHYTYMISFCNSFENTHRFIAYFTAQWLPDYSRNCSLRSDEFSSHKLVI